MSEDPRARIARLRASLDSLTSEGGRGDAYVEGKGSPLERDERVRRYLRIRQELIGAERILDWGCRHGPSAQLARADFGHAIELHGTDICDAGQYAAMHALSDVRYRQVTHPSRLDYADEFFDAIIAADVLEHVPHVSASLTELWRALRPGGALLITHLPNAFSWSEWVSRRIFPAAAHPRRYRPRSTRRLLLDHGFLIERMGYHHFPPPALPPALERRTFWRAVLGMLQPTQALESIWPFRSLSAAIWLVARKHQGF